MSQPRIHSLVLVWGLHAVAALATAWVAVRAWHSGGIYSSELNWLFVVPMLPFYLLGRRHGNVWLAAVIAVLTALAWLPGRTSLGAFGRKDIALHVIPARSAELGRPFGRRPAALLQDCLPRQRD